MEKIKLYLVVDTIQGAEFWDEDKKVVLDFAQRVINLHRLSRPNVAWYCVKGVYYIVDLDYAHEPNNYATVEELIDELS